MKKDAKLGMVQLRNPRTDRYIKIDRDAGKIVGAKKSEGPYENIPIARKTKSRTIKTSRRSTGVKRKAVRRAVKSTSKKEEEIMKKIVMIIVDEEFNEGALWPTDYEGVKHALSFPVADDENLWDAGFFEKRLALFSRIE